MKNKIWGHSVNDNTKDLHSFNLGLSPNVSTKESLMIILNQSSAS